MWHPCDYCLAPDQLVMSLVGVPQYCYRNGWIARWQEIQHTLTMFGILYTVLHNVCLVSYGLFSAMMPHTISKYSEKGSEQDNIL